MNRSVAADLGSGHVQLAQRKQAAGDAEAQLAGQVESLLRDWPAGDPVVDAHWDALGAMRCSSPLLPSRSNFQLSRLRQRSSEQPLRPAENAAAAVRSRRHAHPRTTAAGHGRAKGRGKTA